MNSAAPTGPSSPSSDPLASEFTAISEVIRNIVSKFLIPQMEIHRLIERCDEAGALWQTNPALGLYLLERINQGHFGRTSDAGDLGKLFREKQRSLCAKVGLPGTEGAAKILRKLEPECCTEGALSDLRELLADSMVLKFFAHLPRLTPNILNILKSRNLRGLITHSLLRELTLNKQFDHGNYPHSKLEEYRLIQAYQQKRPPFRSLSEIHGRLNSSTSHRPFPAPPLALPANFKPLTSAEDLSREGKTQHNCVGAYSQRILSNEYYVYNLDAPERATISVRRMNDRWKLSQIKLASNREVHWDTEDYVNEVIGSSQEGRAGPVPIPTLEYPALRNFTGVVFPPPPLVLPENFEPLSSPLKLLQPGKISRERLEEFLAPIRDGRMYAYRLMDPVEVTVMLHNHGYILFQGGMMVPLDQNWEVADMIAHGEPVTWEICQQIRDAVEITQRRHLNPFGHVAKCE